MGAADVASDRVSVLPAFVPAGAGSATAGAGVVDARPALPVASADRSLWDRAAERRDWIGKAIEAYFKRRGIRAWVRKSKPGEYPLTVAVDSWVPIEDGEVAAMVDRTSLTVTISVEPYRKVPLLYRVQLNRHARSFDTEHWDLAVEDLAQMVNYLLDGGERPRYFLSRVPPVRRLVGMVIPFVGMEKKNKLIEAARPNYMTTPTLVCAASLAAAGFIALQAVFGAGEVDFDDSDRVMKWLLAAVIAVAGMGLATWLARQRPVVQAIPKQSLRCPRREFRIDSWHVSVPGAGSGFDEFKQRIYRAASAGDPSLEVKTEVHQNATPRGFEERERMVLGRGQATLHLHVYRFAEDAFVGWDSHLNWNRWAEGGLVSSTVRDGRSVQYKALEVGLHLPTEFDLIEADVLTETAHRRIVEEIKAFLKEREVEADLDFKIIRGDRSRALEEGKDGRARS